MMMMSQRERSIRMAETLILAMASAGLNQEMGEIMTEYNNMLFPEHAQETTKFEERAKGMFEQFEGKLVALNKSGSESGRRSAQIISKKDVE